MMAYAKNPWLQAAGLAIAWAASILTAVWLVSADRAEAKTTIATHGRDLVDHEERLRQIESKVTTIATDVRWIRGAMEEETQ